MKIAFVHDYLNQYGGAERILETLCEIFPNAPIFTLLYDETATGGVFKGREIYTSFLQKIPFSKKHHRFFPLFMPIAVEQFDLSYYDLVFSISASFGKGIITKPKTQHINYCLTPTRFLWDDSHKYIDEFRYPWPIKKLIPMLVTYLRIWDKEAALRVNKFVAISEFVQTRIKKYYHQESEIIYPPIRLEKYKIANQVGDYFLMVGRLVSYKRFDLAIKVFNAIGKPLKIIGDGPERKKLEKLAKHNIEFLGLVSDSRMPDFYAKAQAVIFPQEEDFGLVPLEAMASGRPVIAYRGGGALETVIDGQTGIFFDRQTEIDLALAIGRYYQTIFNPESIRTQAAKFDLPIFKEKIQKLLLGNSLTNAS